MKAALKREKSREYQELLLSGYILKSGLDEFLFDYLLPLINAKQD